MYPRVRAFVVKVAFIQSCIRLRFDSADALLYITLMKSKDENIEMNIADAIMEKPVGFNIGSRHFCLYPPTLGKIYLLSRLARQLEVNPDNMKASPYLESLRVCREKRNIVCRIISYHSLNRKPELLDETKVSKRESFFNDNLSEEELAQLLVIVTSWDNADSYIRHFGLDKERELRRKIAELKSKNNTSVSFGGRSTYGTIIDFACQRYGWTMDYVVWGISYVNLQMLMADAINSVHLSKEEMKKLRIPQDRTYISADDPSNIEKIKAMDWR